MRRILLLILGLGLAACEVVFDPILPSDTAFSVSGYLDASADTQWVRVERFAPTTDVEPGPLAVDVTLEDLASGGVVTLTQQVRTLTTGPAHLFWTTQAVALGARYRVQVRGDDGATATAEVEIPDEDDVDVVIVSGPFICPTSVSVFGAERVADIQARYRIADGGGVRDYTVTHIDTAVRPDANTVQTSIYPDDDLQTLNLSASAQVLATDIVVGVATEAWPDVVGVTLEDALRLESDIENGLGFLGGVVTQRTPFTPGAGSGRFGQNVPCTRP